MQYFKLKSTSIESILFFLFLLFLPTQFGKHFWPSFSLVLGQRIDYLAPTIYVTDILVGLLFFVWWMGLTGKASKLKALFKKILLHPLPSILFLPFPIFLLLNISLSQSPQEGLYGLLKLLEIFFLIYYTNNFLRKNSKIFIFPLAFGIISESVLAIVQFFTQGSIGGLLYYLGERTFTSVTPGIANASINGQLLLRPYGTFPHPNVLAGYLVISMTMLLLCHSGLSGISQPYKDPGQSCLSAGRARMTNIFYWFIFLLGTIGLLFTLSRVAVIIWGLVLLYFFFKTVLKKTLNTLYILLSTIAIALVLFLLQYSPLFPRFRGLTLQDESVVLREQLTVDAFRMLFAHPWVGVGLNNFLIALPSYDFRRESVFSIQPVHNIFLLIGAETGFFGFWLVISFVIWLYMRLFKKVYVSVGNGLKPFPTMIFLLLTEVVIFGSFDHYFLTIQQGQLLLGLVIGILI